MKNVRRLVVKSAQRVTPHMQRVVFSGESLSDFPVAYESGYIKFLFTPNGAALKNAGELKRLSGSKPIMRTYTVRSFDAEALLLTVDFVIHAESEGPASKWAANAKAGDEILIAGPGPAKLVNSNANWFLIVGDMTALPAISCNLEKLPSDAQGHVFIEVESKADVQALAVPMGIQLHWVLKGEDTLADKVIETPWRAGQPYVWCACEFSTMRRLRAFFKNEKLVSRDSMYISSYWKQGANEDQHKIAKHRDAA